MFGHDLAKIKTDYERDGFVSGVRLLSENDALAHRGRLEQAEKKIGNMHYKSKVHTILTSPYEIATMPSVLDIVERIIGPDILLYNATYIIKEPGTSSHVSWHQDLTYWGFSDDDQIAMWLALSPATAESGCMRMIPGSHKTGFQKHNIMDDEDNVLWQSQTVNDVDESSAIMCPLAVGEASFHHGWTLHGSLPNTSDDRRIGLSVNYLAAHMSQTKNDHDTAVLVRGTDTYGHFCVDIPAQCDLDPAAVQKQAELDARLIEITAQG